MSTGLNGELSEQAILTSVIERLSSVAETKLDYSATGLYDSLDGPVILVRLESLAETARQGEKGRFELQFAVNAVIRTSEQTTLELMTLVRKIRTALNSAEKLCPETRKHVLSDTRFDIASDHDQLSFAVSTLMVEAIL